MLRGKLLLTIKKIKNNPRLGQILWWIMSLLLQVFWGLCHWTGVV